MLESVAQLNIQIVDILLTRLNFLLCTIEFLLRFLEFLLQLSLLPLQGLHLTAVLCLTYPHAQAHQHHQEDYTLHHILTHTHYLIYNDRFCRRLMILSTLTCLYLLVFTSVRVDQSELFFRLLRFRVTCAAVFPVVSFIFIMVGNFFPP